MTYKVQAPRARRHARRGARCAVPPAHVHVRVPHRAHRGAPPHGLARGKAGLRAHRAPLHRPRKVARGGLQPGEQRVVEEAREGVGAGRAAAVPRGVGHRLRRGEVAQAVRARRGAQLHQRGRGAVAGGPGQRHGGLRVRAVREAQLAGRGVAPRARGVPWDGLRGNNKGVGRGVAVDAELQALAAGLREGVGHGELEAAGARGPARAHGEVGPGAKGGGARAANAVLRNPVVGGGPLQARPGELKVRGRGGGGLGRGGERHGGVARGCEEEQGGAHLHCGGGTGATCAVGGLGAVGGRRAKWRRRRGRHRGA